MFSMRKKFAVALSILLGVAFMAMTPAGSPAASVDYWSPQESGPEEHLLAQPVIETCSPTAVHTGHTVDLHLRGSNTNFQNGVSRATVSGAGVTINSTRVSDSTHATSSITIASGAPSGARDVNVITGDEIPDPLVGGLTVYPAPSSSPFLNTRSPASGPVGTRVTLNGGNFGNARGSSEVTFNGVPVTTYIYWSDSEIICEVPFGATTGPIQVVTPWGTSGGLTFTVTDFVYYFAEGTCRPDFDTYICIQNPEDTEAEVKITYMKGDGTTEEQTLSVAPESRATVTAKDILGVGDDAAHDFSAKVESTNGVDIVCERPMYFNYAGFINGGSIVVGALAPSAQFYFAEGSCRPNFYPYICIQNPSDSEANVKITYMKGDGTTEWETLAVAPQSRSTVTVKDKLGEGDDVAHDFSARVESTNGVDIVCERPMYFNYGPGWTGGHDVMGAVAPFDRFYFAEGSCRPDFDPYICIQNPRNAQAEVKITYMKGDGTEQEQFLSVAEHSRKTVTVKEILGEGDGVAYDFSARVESTNGVDIVCERPMYFNYHGVWTGGHDVMGALAPSPDFYFAEGTCRPDFDSYICIQNPELAHAEVKITYMKGDGSTEEQTLAVAAHSRRTVTVKDILGEGDGVAYDFSARVESTNGVDIVCERPVYFNYQGWCTGGHDVMGF